MKFAEAKMICQSGGLSGARIYRSTGDRWHLQFITKKAVDFTLALETERGSDRAFKKIDAAISAAKNIGVAEVNVVLKS